MSSTGLPPPEPAWGRGSLARLTRFFRHRLGLLLPLAAVAALAIFAVTELAYQRSTGSLTSLSRRDEAHNAIDTVLRRLLDAESAQRGYLITGRPEYLRPNEQVVSDMAAAFKVLEEHYNHDPTLSAVVKDMRARAEEKQSELAITVRLYDEGQHERWRDLVLTNIGREKTEAVRKGGEILMAAEEQREQVDRTSLFSTLGISRVGVHVLTAVSLLAIALFIRNTRALDESRRRHAAELQAERDELEAQVKRRTTELTALAQHLQSAREDERSRLARELHDELGALLTAAKLDVARLKRGIGAMTPDLEGRVRHLNQTIDQGISLKRRIIEDLRPSSLSNLGLVAALEIQAREFAARSNLLVQAHVEEVELSDSAQITVYRVVQESLTNIAKYASARQVTITLQPDADRVRVAVEDDGAGFEMASIKVGSHGLTGMRYRVESAGGALQVSSAPGRGTKVEAWLPAGDPGRDVPVDPEANLPSGSTEDAPTGLDDNQPRPSTAKG